MWSVPSSLPPRDERTDIFSSSVLFCVPSIFRLFCDIHKMTWNIFPFHRHRAQDAHKYFLENKNWCSVLFCSVFCRTEQNRTIPQNIFCVLSSLLPPLDIAISDGFRTSMSTSQWVLILNSTWTGSKVQTETFYSCIWRTNYSERLLAVICFGCGWQLRVNLYPFPIKTIPF